MTYKALITGASRGIGAEIKKLFEEKNITVFSPTQKEMNLENPQSIKAYTQTLKDGVDILVNCAGINEILKLEEIEQEKYLKTFQINLFSQIQLIQWAAPFMKQKNYGRIVNFSSIWSKFSKEGRMVYATTKAAVNGLTTSAAVELGTCNILVNAIAPGFVNTQMTSQNNTSEQLKIIAESIPLRRLSNPSEIAKLCYFLCSQENTFMTGQTLFIDGGFSCI